MTTGERIREAREKIDMTQDELAQKAGYKSRSSINKIEKSRELPLQKAKAIADALDCTPGYIMGWEKEHDVCEKSESTYDTGIYERYRELRNSQGLRDADIARMTNITQSTLSDWKNRKSMPNALKMVAIAHSLNTSVEYLITGEQSGSPYNITPRQLHLLELWSQLSPNQHENVMALIDSFAIQNNRDTHFDEEKELYAEEHSIQKNEHLYKLIKVARDASPDDLELVIGLLERLKKEK